MQSGVGKSKKWLLEYYTKDSKISPLMGWESTDDTLGEIKLNFSSKEKAVEYAKKNNINYDLFEPKKKEFVLKSYSDNFTKN